MHPASTEEASSLAHIVLANSTTIIHDHIKPHEQTMVPHSQLEPHRPTLYPSLLIPVPSEDSDP